MATLACRSLMGSLFVLAPLAAGCSAIVTPDPGRLGAGDTGRSSLDAASDDGGRLDGGAPLDASTLLDTFSPFDTGSGLDAGSDSGPVCPPSCDDGVVCTADACEGGRCVHTPDDAFCPGARCSPTMGCVPVACTADAECDDGDRCNGAERCSPGSSPTGCVPAERPLDCDDGAACTDDACDPAMGCVHARVDARCDDRVACTTDVCTGSSGSAGCEHRPNDAVCNTGCTMGARCTPSGCAGGSPLVCTDDGTPCTVERCDAAAGGCVRDPLDADMDGFPAARVVSSGMTFLCAGGTDCDDTRRGVNPSATEICGNGLDDDCNPSTSDVCATTGDTCAAPTPIPISAGRGSVTVTLTSFADDYDTRCGGGRGNDAVFYFDVTTTSDVRIETSGTVDTVLATAYRCDGDAFRSRCNDDRDRGTDTTSRIWLHPVTVPFGMSSVRVYVLVDEYDVGDADPVTLTVTVTSPPAINACPGSSGPRPLDLSGGGTVIGTLSGLGGAVGGQRGSCQSPTSTAPEAVFRIEEPDRTLDELIASTSSFVPDLYVRGGLCSSGTEIRCVNGTSSGGSGGTATLTSLVHPSSTGTVFYAFVDNAPLSSVEYTLDLDP
ncbi:MAG: hypothetical protein OHK0013_40350 [Sandaracinaceae bacterium]